MTDRVRFERLAIVHLNSAWRLANSIVRNATDAEDVVQEAYLRAFQAFERFSGEDIRPWLLTIVRNAALQRLATRRRSLNLVSLDEAFTRRDGGAAIEDRLAAIEPTAEMQLIAKADQAMVSAALAELSTSFREILVLREFEGCSYSEIAKIIGTPTGTVMSRLARARGELKRVLIRMIGNGGPSAE
jgi:RNA polymerase sigma-70 factor (ECF subfamily)